MKLFVIGAFFFCALVVSFVLNDTATTTQTEPVSAGKVAAVEVVPVRKPPPSLPRISSVLIPNHITVADILPRLLELVERVDFLHMASIRCNRILEIMGTGAVDMPECVNFKEKEYLVTGELEEMMALLQGLIDRVVGLGETKKEEFGKILTNISASLENIAATKRHMDFLKGG